MRPGYLRSVPQRQPRNLFRGLGGFGKGAMVPPPSAVPIGPAVFENGKWICEGPKPQAEPDGMWTCCPSGWKKAPFGEQNPCKGEEDLLICGTLPEGMEASQVKCCADQKRWAVVSGGADPCGLPGQQGPLTSDDILAPELEIEREPILSPKLMLVGGVVVVTLLGLAFLAR